jgi:hypothetical protein
MGVINKGILGPFSGIVGTVIGGTWKGISYMRSRPMPVDREPTMRQLQQRAKFKLVVRFLQSLTPLITVTFKEAAVQMSGFNAAFKYNISTAVTGSYPDFELAYGNVLVSRGDLPNALNPSAVLGNGAQIKFSWTVNSGMGKAADTDKSVKVVYCPARNQAIFDFGAERSAQTDTIPVNAFAGETVHTWLAFLSENAKSVATSIYTGSMVVPA